MLRLDVLVQAVVQDRGRTSPPATPGDGQCHLVASGATGLWSGRDGAVAAFIGNDWEFLTPRIGWRLWVLDEAAEVVLTATGWQGGPEAPIRAGGVGVNATADATNRLVVAAPATLLTHEGGGHQVKVNKATVADTASLLFQTGFFGRAEMGLAGKDDFSVKVSTDGSAFTEALRINGATGLISGTAVSAGPADATAGRVLTVGAGPVQLDGSVYSRTNGVGTVSQSAGVPTGALMERGGNANGEYLRLADGTQFCWGQISITPVANTPTLAPWTFPAAFADSSVPSVLVTGNSAVPGSQVTEVSFANPTLTGCSIALFRINTTTTVLRLFAIGRWF